LIVIDNDNGIARRGRGKVVGEDSQVYLGSVRPYDVGREPICEHGHVPLLE
jgi:hypothetical protein